MAPILLYFDFPFAGPWGAEMAVALEGLAQDIGAEDGLIWKIWTENREDRRAGGVYLFRDPISAERYRRKHAERLTALGIENITAKAFEANMPLSAMTRAPL